MVTPEEGTAEAGVTSGEAGVTSGGAEATSAGAHPEVELTSEPEVDLSDVGMSEEVEVGPSRIGAGECGDGVGGSGFG